MKITKKHLVGLLFTLLYCLPLAFSPYLAIPVRADESLLSGQIGINEVKPLFGGAKAEEDPRKVIAEIIAFALSFLAVIFLALTVFAGFKYMTSGGNQDKAREATKLLQNAIIGLVIVLAAWALTRFSIVILNRAVRNDPSLDYPAYGM